MAKKSVQKKETKNPSEATEKYKVTGSESTGFAFDRQNYKLLFIGLFLILVGFILMIGGGSDDPNKFSEDIFNFRRLTLAPILILAGYVVEIFAIMKKPKD
ncbi:MAG: DUF3098 domain-containing protein [Bacteroidales bacterium]|nr:DUF3098 domain-containing protein [Bacteroidales bacterium]